jgi:phenylacetic acid degradation operon negative regulatory protein
MIRYFHKSEASIRTGLSRMAKSGIVVSRREASETIYELTKEGVDNLNLWNRGLSRFFSRYSLRQKDWNGMWHLLTISEFNKSDYDNQYIVDELRECGLREISSNVWAAPYPIDEDIYKLLNDREFRYLKLQASISSNMDLNGLLNDAFELSTLKQKYMEFLHKADETGKRVTALHGGALLPVLFETGWDFYDTVTSDPALPKALLQEWEGDRAVVQMKTMRPMLYREITRYFLDNNI